MKKDTKVNVGIHRIYMSRVMVSVEDACREVKENVRIVRKDYEDHGKDKWTVACLQEQASTLRLMVERLELAAKVIDQVEG